MNASRKRGVSARPQLSASERRQRMREHNAALTGVEAIERAREIALRQLDSRSRSRAELRGVILDRGFSEETADEVMERLERVGLVDDRAHAQAFVRDRHRNTGKVGRALVEDMRRRGLSQDDIDEAMSQIDSDEEYRCARELVRKKLRIMASVSYDSARRKLTSMLSRRGYSPHLVFSVVKEELDAFQAGHEDDQCGSFSQRPGAQ